MANAARCELLAAAPPKRPGQVVYRPGRQYLGTIHRSLCSGVNARAAGSAYRWCSAALLQQRRDGLLVVGRLVPPHQSGGQGRAWVGYCAATEPVARWSLHQVTHIACDRCWRTRATRCERSRILMPGGIRASLGG